MGKIGIVAGVFILIVIYLIGTNSTGISSTIGALADPTLKGVALLQGRPVKGVTV